MSYAPDARSRLSLLILFALPASLLPGCGDQVTNHFHSYYGDGGAGSDAPVPTAGEDSNGSAGTSVVPHDGGESGEGNEPAGGAGGSAGEGNPLIDPNYPDAPIADT